MTETRLRRRVWLKVSPARRKKLVKGAGDYQPFECLGQSVCFTFDFEDLDGFVGGACCKPAAIVVELGIMLYGAVRKAGRKEVR
jgi:hypothetical protein